MVVILLDNGRTNLLAQPDKREALRCIRCGACLNVCPVYKNIGGHTYETTYSGPIGSVISPHLCGLAEHKHLSFASSLCGACTIGVPGAHSDSQPAAQKPPAKRAGRLTAPPRSARHRPVAGACSTAGPWTCCRLRPRTGAQPPAGPGRLEQAPRRACRWPPRRSGSCGRRGSEALQGPHLTVKHHGFLRKPGPGPLTQQQVADLADISLRNLKQIEAGRANPGLQPLLRLLYVLGLELTLDKRSNA